MKEKIGNGFGLSEDCVGKFMEKVKRVGEWKKLVMVCVGEDG